MSTENGAEPVDATAEEVGTEVALREQSAALIFRTDDPVEIMRRTSEVAEALKQFVKSQGLTVAIRSRDYIVVEGWQMLGMMLGVSPIVTATRPVENGWEAVVELHDRSGRVVGAGEAECLNTEKDWQKREDYARRSMAQTRAIGKAYRNTFGFIAKAAGYEVLPAEEAETDASSHAPEMPPHDASAEAKRLDQLNLAILGEMEEQHGLNPTKSEALFDGHRTLERKRALHERLTAGLEKYRQEAPS